ncbi:KamA family protein [Ancylomarina salipaludis]|uniref:KamA family protein n=1 Tax=Ancylomarina salipaludis TaxID=2501299 RepID=A0A4Q1JRR8_9BACT|nr:KamA family protein [Ancylomarina salipaludis]RXQ97485.1 KamA family protein [Ancylomarina salipaludis]
MVSKGHQLDHIAISVKSHMLLKQLLKVSPILEEIMSQAKNSTEALEGVRYWVLAELKKHEDAYRFYKGKVKGRDAYEKLSWRDFAAIRILDYIDNAGREFHDPNIGNEKAVTNPVKLIWLAVNYGTGGAKPYFFNDMLYLFRQFCGTYKREIPARERIEAWMDRWCTGLDPRIIKLREENRERIVNVLIEKIDSGEIKSKTYIFPPDLSDEQKYFLMLKWWDDYRFHLSFAVRSPDLLNELLDESLDPDSMKILYKAEKKGIPFFVNPYYLSLLHVRVPYFAIGADLAIRYYVLYSQQLIDEYGHIVAWEKEDLVEPGKPNAAGWLLPSNHNIHRRYPEVAILIPDTMGRACAGLCASCQRMFDFQRGNLNFNLDKLKPKDSWPDKLNRLLEYFEFDSQLRDILITGGDAFMCSNQSLKQILDAVYDMAARKKKANEKRPDGEKYAEILRVRLGTRIPVYLPQRINAEFVQVLKDFKHNASQLGVKKFIVQTHFESPMELTPEAREAVRLLNNAGWTVTNQLVLTSAASRRGHSAKLRQVLNEIGVLNYYTFSVKGYMENSFNFATNERSVQELTEEKRIGQIPPEYEEEIFEYANHAEDLVDNIRNLMRKLALPFLATDRNVLNLPGVGKSMTFRTIGITRYGRRILEFELDKTRAHSPAVHEMDKVIIIESKSIGEYLNQLEEMGEEISDYESIWGYSIGETEPRMSLFEYPEYDYKLTDEVTNLGEIE